VARCKNPLGLVKHPSEAQQAAEKKSDWAGAEARLIPLTLSARLKPCPYYKAYWIEFFRSL
jgi:hypothetical protein